MRKRGLIQVIERALIYRMDDGADIPAVIDCLLEGIRKTLKCDPRLSRLTHREFNLLFVAFADGARRLLGEHARIEWEYAVQHVDWEYVARIVTDAVIAEISDEFYPHSTNCRHPADWMRD
jgi:hypothetical protein